VKLFSSNPYLWLSASALAYILLVGAAGASGGLKTVSGDRITIDHGDNPNGVGGVDAISFPGGSGNSGGAPSPGSHTTSGRARAKLSNNPSVRPQP